MNDRDSGRSRSASMIVGLLLIVVGAAFFAVQVLDVEVPIDLGSVGWPLFVIAPGVVLLVVGLFLPAEAGVGLSVAGGIATTVGLLLAYQSSADHYASWAYAWALVVPASAGAAMTAWGLIHGDGKVTRNGLGALGVGLAIVLVGFGFFEGLLNLGGERGLAPLGRQALPLALIVVGALVIVARLWPRRQPEWPSQSPWSTPGPESVPQPAAPVGAPGGPAAPSSSAAPETSSEQDGSPRA